jgi:hypothetical protein
MHPFLLQWSAPFPDHHYHPLYLANTTFGGLLDLSGHVSELWGPAFVCRPPGLPSHSPAHPVTALDLQIFHRSPALRKGGVWLGAAGIRSDDPRHAVNTAMPGRPVLRDRRQSLDLSAGLATTSGRLALGGVAAPAAFTVPFSTRVVFLKDEPLLSVECLVPEDVETLLVPDPIVEERFRLDLTGRGVHRLGNEIRCDLLLRQQAGFASVGDHEISRVMRPEGGAPYAVALSAPGSEVVSFEGRPALLLRGRFCYSVRISLVDTPSPASPFAAADFPLIAAEQSRRWGAFWAASSVRLPAAEALWQQRYHTHLFQVEQSLGDGPTHPGGISKPMLPYWLGCFHDTDTYFCRPLLETGRFAGPARHLAYRHRTLAAARAAAASQGLPGALYPWQTDPDGRGETDLVPINAAIIACEAWHHARFTGTPAAAAQAREILAATFDLLASLLDTSAQPLRLRPVPLRTFSETIVAEDPAEARIALRAVAAALLDSGRDSPLARRVLAELALPRRASGGYAITPGPEPLYLRCPSVTLGSFPLHHLPPDQALANALDDEHARVLDRFAWLPHQASVVASQLGRREACDLLRAADAFYKPWHAFDEWEHRRTVRATFFVTAGGGFCTALHHLLLAETSPGEWSLFPGAPEDWTDLAFERLRTRHGWIVSAARERGRLVRLHAEPAHATAAPLLRLRHGAEVREFRAG